MSAVRKLYVKVYHKYGYSLNPKYKCTIRFHKYDKWFLLDNSIKCWKTHCVSFLLRFGFISITKMVSWGLVIKDVYREQGFWQAALRQKEV